MGRPDAQPVAVTLDSDKWLVLTAVAKRALHGTMHERNTPAELRTRACDILEEIAAQAGVELGEIHARPARTLPPGGHTA